MPAGEFSKFSDESFIVVAAVRRPLYDASEPSSETDMKKISTRIVRTPNFGCCLMLSIIVDKFWTPLFVFRQNAVARTLREVVIRPNCCSSLEMSRLAIHIQNGRNGLNN